jgi:hypothetical protein
MPALIKEHAVKQPIVVYRADTALLLEKIYNWMHAETCEEENARAFPG